jgi:hypothetical protein
VGVVTPRTQRVLVAGSWALAGVAATMAAYGLFAMWAVNAEPLGRNDMGAGLFLALSGAWALIACLWLAPACALLTLVAWLTRAGSPLGCLVAAVAAGAPIVLLALRG